MQDSTLILGASSDIGVELIKTLDHEELKIFAHSFSSPERVSELQVKSKIEPIVADLGDTQQCEALIKKVQDEGLPSKIVILAAPAIAPKRFRETGIEEYLDQFNVQLKGPVQILKGLLPVMVKQKIEHPKIVFMLSSSVLSSPPTNLISYVSMKYAVMGFMKALAAEYASKKVAINAVAPTMMETRYLKEFPELLVELNAKNHPQKRNANPKDVVGAIEFLLSRKSDFITGTVLPITGGSEF